MAEDVLSFMREHIQRYEASNGEDGHIMNGSPCLIINTVGKKSGAPRQAAVIYGQQEKNYIVVASKGGSDSPPAWFVNLAAAGTAHIQVKVDKLQVQMRIAEGAERDTLWQKMVDIFPDYIDYQQKTDRQIPVVVLEPVS